jgi:hypothetical protein
MVRELWSPSQKSLELFNTEHKDFYHLSTWKAHLSQTRNWQLQATSKLGLIHDLEVEMRMLCNATVLA